MLTDFEANLLDRILDPVTRCLTTEAAERLAGLRADPASQQRIDDLAEKSSEGQLSADDLAEYQAYVSAANVLAIMQSKARRLLAGDTAA